LNGSDAIVVGLTTYGQRVRSGVWDVEAAFLQQTYLDAVAASGAVANLLPPQSPHLAVAALGRVDALVVTGGSDVDPAAYGAAAHPETDVPQPGRDAWETALLHAAILADLPVLAICRGAQVLNVARGGTLHQHVPDLVGHRDHRTDLGVFTANDVRTEPGSIVASIVGERLPGQCHHHQSIAELGEGLVVTARDATGVVEAVELPTAAFCVGVQWHPEETATDRRLFEALVDATCQEVLA
jgi:putative glutamine amidotransferase